MIVITRARALALAALAGTLACSGGGGDGGGTTQTAAGHSISGNARAAAATDVDGDTADPNAPVAHNDTPSAAQQLASAVTVGGWASQAVDEVDVYAATLGAGQVVTLTIADPAEADLDLLLYTAPGMELVASVETGAAVKSLAVASGGSYYIVVDAAPPPPGGSGGSNYLLSLGQGAAVAAGTQADGLSSAADFVPGEVIVRFRDAPHVPAAAKTLAARAASLGMIARGGGPGREMRLELGSGADRARAFAALGLDPEQQPRFGPPLLDPIEREKRDTVRIVKALRQRADVETADPNYIRHAARTPNDEYYGYQWHYPILKLPQAWDVTTGTPASGDVIVAVIDTGILPGHPEFAGKLVAGYDFISNATSARDGNGIDSDPTDMGDSAVAGQSSWHGSHVAGTIAAKTDDGTGVAGVSWGARIMPIRALGLGGSGTSHDILQAVRFAAGLPNDSPIVLDDAQKADVINLSLGGSASSAGEQMVYNEARNAGVIVVAAAGNKNSSDLFYPASYDGVISVSAVDMALAKAPYSNYGAKVDVAAPGGNLARDADANGYPDGVLSPVGDDSSGTIRYAYRFLQGTSMASPHVAGVMALMRAVCPNLAPAAVDALIAAGSITVDRGAAGRDDIYGHGVLDALAAVQQAQAACSAEPTLVLDAVPARLDFEPAPATSVLTVSVEKRGGTAALGATVAVTSDAPWLSAEALSVDAEGLGTYAVTVNRGGLADGVYSATLTFAAGARSVTVPVTMRIGSWPATGNVGHLYILLVDRNLNAVRQAERSAASGGYPYGFQDVPAGEYFVVAGTDSDGDGYICDAGESCGAYPTLAQPAVVTSSPVPTTGVDFLASFDASLGRSVALEGAPAVVVPPEGIKLQAPKRVGPRP